MVEKKVEKSTKVWYHLFSVEPLLREMVGLAETQMKFLIVEIIGVIDDG